MSALKAHEVARYLQNPDLSTGIFLVYGPDHGLVRETATQLLRHFEGKSPDPMTKLSLEGSELAADPSRLAVEARTIPMFGGNRCIRVRNAGKTLKGILLELLEDMPDAAIVLEAGNLPPRDGLRALIEASPKARALPCYGDNSETLGNLIRQTFASADISVDQEAISSLRETLGNDREITRSELEKLTLFALESKNLTREDIIALCGDNAALAIDEILDAAGSGRVEKLDDAISRALAAAIDPQRLLIAALMHFTWLRRLRVDVDAGKSPREALDRAKPRPHFSRKSSLEQQLRLWNDDNLSSASARIYEAIAHSRKTSNLAEAIVHRALLAVCVAAAHH